jgi:hypothetical protein
MSSGSVTIAQVNNLQGSTPEVERVFLWIGSAAESGRNGELLTITPQTDLDAMLGSAESELKSNMEAAIANAKDSNFFAYAVPIAPDTDDWRDVASSMLAPPVDLNVEGIVLTTPVTSSDEIEEAQYRLGIIGTMVAKPLTCHMAAPGIDGTTQSWSDYLQATIALSDGIVADRVAVVPQLHGNNLGVVIGRLCDPAASLADTPMRVATGALIGLGSALLATDNSGQQILRDHLIYLSNNRFSVPQVYPGYDGTYWADHPLLDAAGGDFQVFEHRRILDYLARRVRILAIGRIADRQLNSTAASIAKHQTYFAKPLREAAHSITIGTREIPGLIQTPSSSDVAITWTSSTEVSIAITARPYNCPKKITVYLGLDLS